MPRRSQAALSSCGAKRRTSCQVRAASRRAKRPKNLHDPAAPSSQIQISKPENHPLRCSSQIPIRGANLLGYPQIPPIWGAKRPRSAFIRPNCKWRDWTNLGEGPAGLIAERLLASDVADYVSFRAVCRPWRLCSTEPRVHGVLDRRFHPHQWIMLRGPSPYRRCFLNSSTGCSRYVDLPELCGHDVFGPTTEGLLVLDTTTYVVRLLNPFTRQAANLPPATTLLSQRTLEEQPYRVRSLCKMSGAGLADDCTIAIQFGWRTIAVAKPGDAHWTVVHCGTHFMPSMSFAGRFYCATNYDVMVVETSADQPPRLAVAANLVRPFSTMMLDTVHLVDNDGELMLVDRICNGSLENRKFKVYRVDLDARKMLPVRALGGRALFIGVELALSVSPLVFPSISADAIYLGFDSLMRGRMDNSPIHLADGTPYLRKFRNRRESMPNHDRLTAGRRNNFGDSDYGMPIYGPWSLDDYLSWCVTGFEDTLEDTGSYKGYLRVPMPS